MAWHSRTTIVNAAGTVINRKVYSVRKFFIDDYTVRKYLNERTRALRTFAVRTSSSRTCWSRIPRS